jgi:hypothetical protein
VSAPTTIDAAHLLATLHAELARVANRANAPAMQAYMKSWTPFLGVSARGLRQVCRREALKNIGPRRRR